MEYTLPGCLCHEPGLGPNWCLLHAPSPTCWYCEGPLYGNRTYRVYDTEFRDDTQVEVCASCYVSVKEVNGG